jgi:CheY-like chemotaxis protein
VLVVEDDPTLRGVIRLVLEKAGYAVDEASHGTAALELLAGAVPDAAVVDSRMPVMNGAELIARMRADARTAAVPVVLLSGFGESAAGASSADAVLAKPFEPTRLIECLKDLAPADT